MVGLFVVAAAVTALAIPPSLVLGGAAYAGRRTAAPMRPSRGGATRWRMLTGDGAARARRLIR